MEEPIIIHSPASGQEGGPLEGRDERVIINGKTWTSMDVYYDQHIRFASVFLIGPFLIYAATLKTIPTYVRVILCVIGVAMIINNGRNYLKTVK